jgi:hypothetical protein
MEKYCIDCKGKVETRSGVTQQDAEKVGLTEYPSGEIGSYWFCYGCDHGQIDTTTPIIITKEQFDKIKGYVCGRNIRELPKKNKEENGYNPTFSGGSFSPTDKA